MRFVVDAAQRNVENRGGPFAAAIFESETGALVSLGVNLVEREKLSILHAEMVAIALAQRCIGGYDLGGGGLPAHELVTSVEPRAMCFGAVPWSGVRRVICGARSSDTEELGFDEGPKPVDWREKLAERGIETICDIERIEAVKVLQEYLKRGGHIYNSREAPRRG